MLLLLLGCAEPGEPVTLLTGWNYTWEELSHRVSYVRVGVEEDTSLTLGLVGGDWSTGASFVDTPHYRVRYQRVTGVHVVRGVATLLVGPDPTATTSVELDASSLPEGAALAAVIDGFTIDTGVPQGPDYPAEYNPAYGYTSNGFGFTLGDAERDGDVVRVPVEATLRWGPQDREDVNAAIPHAVVEVRLEVAVVAGSEVVALEVGAEADYEWDPPWSDQAPMETSARFEGGAAEGVVAWRSFDLRLDAADGEGDYLRAYGVEVVPTAAETGAFEADVTAELSTSSLSEWTDPAVAFSGELVRIGAPDVVAEHWVVEGSHPTGAAETGPTAE